MIHQDSNRKYKYNNNNNDNKKTMYVPINIYKRVIEPTRLQVKRLLYVVNEHRMMMMIGCIGRT